MLMEQINIDDAFSFRMNSQIKQKAFEVIRNYGLTPSQVLNMLLIEIATTKTIPLSLNYQAETSEENNLGAKP